MERGYASLGSVKARETQVIEMEKNKGMGMDGGGGGRVNKIGLEKLKRRKFCEKGTVLIASRD